MGSNRLLLRNNSRYAPIRYEATRPYAIRLGKLFWNKSQEGDAARLRFVGHELLPLIRRELDSLGRQAGPGPGQAETLNIQVFGGYLAGGRMIFDVHRLLTQALAVTDIEDIPCGALSFPASQFYLHFGPSTGILDDGLEIEGAFVQHVPSLNRLIFDLVPVGTFASPQFWRLPMGEQLTGIRIDLDNPDQSIASALATSVQSVVERNEAFHQQVAELEKQLTAQYGQPIKVPTPNERIVEKAPVLRRALQLVVNTLFYLSSCEDDVSEGWEPETPADLLHQAEHAEKPGTRKSALNTITNQGYIKVRYLGSRFAESGAGKALGEAIATGRTMPTHLRRGHMRRQPYGPERALRKVIFIPPVIVNADRADASPGRVYDVRPDD